MDATTAGLISTAIAGFSGLAGASIGALVTVSVSRSTSARQWNHDLFTESRGLYLELIETINEQYIALNADAMELKSTYERIANDARKFENSGGEVDFNHSRSPESSARIAEVTGRFRKVVAKAIIYGDEGMGDQLNELDSSRERVTIALNRGDLKNALTEIEAMGTLLRPLYRTAQRGITRHSLVALNNFHPFRGKRKARHELLANISLLDERDAADAAKLEDSPKTGA